MKNKSKLFLAIVCVLILCVSMVMLVACNGKPGKSAYEIAVENGFTGTVTEWLESLKGEQGNSGGAGSTGKSAYEIAVENGFEGTVTEWLESLKGETGEPGQPGEGLENGKLVFTESGKLTIGGLDSGLTWADTTKIAFTQLDETLNGVVNISVFNPENAFDTIKFSIYREGAVINEVEYIDYIAQNVELEGNDYYEKITAPYYGKYTVKIECIKGEDVLFTKTKDIAFKASQYNFIYSNVTMPVLYAAAEMVQFDHAYPTYVAIQRSDTFDWYNLPENTYAIPNSTFISKTTRLALYDSEGVEKTCEYGSLVNGSWGQIYNKSNTGEVTVALKQMKYWIGELYSLSDNATFHFYGDDITTPVTIWWTYGNNMDASRFDITLYPDGAGSTNSFKKYYGTKAKYDEKKAEYDRFVRWLQAGHDISSIWGNYAVPMAMENNIRYVVNSKPNMVASIPTAEEEYINAIKSHITQYTVPESLETVGQLGKTNELAFLLRTKWRDNIGAIGDANSYFEKDNGKKNLLIIGTSKSGENNSNGCGANTSLLTFMDYIVETYGDEYNIFYKGHPGWPISDFKDGRDEYFAEHGIVVLPNAVPAETYMFLYNEVYIGGYYSTTMASSKIGQTLFFIGQEDRIKAQSSTASMFDENADDYLGVFENTIFITVDTIAEDEQQAA